MSEKDEYLSLFVKHNHRLFNFTLTLVPNYSDAEDILQDVAKIMWQKFGTYQKGTNFLAWACKIIRYRVSNYYRTVNAQFRLDEDILDRLSMAQHEAAQHANKRRSALSGCLNKLSPADRNLIEMRFIKGVKVQKIAKQSNQSAHTLYKHFSAIYFSLQNCIQRTLIEWGVNT